MRKRPRPRSKPLYRDEEDQIVAERAEFAERAETTTNFSFYFFYCSFFTVAVDGRHLLARPTYRTSSVTMARGAALKRTSRSFEAGIARIVSSRRASLAS
jgi:hypothetical protein